jgi:Mg/Co/Ni transporter MgtE
MRASDSDACVVVNDAGVVLGNLSREALLADPEMPVEQAMEPGQATVRPHMMLIDLRHYLQKRNLDSIMVTTAEGRFLGLVYLQDIIRKLDETEAQSA